MNRKDSPQSVIDSYRKRQQMTPIYMAGVAIVLVIVGLVILFLWFRNSDGQNGIALNASPTATATQEPLATETPIPPTATTEPTATITLSPTVTETATPAGPMRYIVQSGDNCWDLATKNKVSLDVLIAINAFSPGTCPINPGDEILIPLPDTELPTETPIPADQRIKVEYYVKVGETLPQIASRFNSTTEAIIAENKITDINKIRAGDKLIVPANIVTPTPTSAATATTFATVVVTTAPTTPVEATATATKAP